jgi:hypothetical protein
MALVVIGAFLLSGFERRTTVLVGAWLDEHLILRFLVEERGFPVVLLLTPWSIFGKPQFDCHAMSEKRRATRFLSSSSDKNSWESDTPRIRWIFLVMVSNEAGS